MKKTVYIFLSFIFLIANSLYLHAEEVGVDEFTINNDVETFQVLEDSDNGGIEEPPAEEPVVSDGKSINTLIRISENVLLDTSEKITREEYIIIDTTGGEHAVLSDTVLGFLIAVDQKLENFSLSQIEYYESFRALYVKCVQVDMVEYCDNWQYVVNGTSPFTSVDQTILEDEDTFIFYFGSPYQIEIPRVAIVGQDFVAQAQIYDYINNIWISRTNVTIGITTPDPDNPWSPLVLTTHPVDENGNVILNINTLGQFQIAIAEDWYFPLYSIDIQNKDMSPSNPTSGGGGTVTEKRFNTQKALDYLESVQDTRGSFVRSDLYTDWATIAFAISRRSNDSLFSYIQSNNKSKNNLTDSIRRVMTLLIMGENPYTFANTNHIVDILDAFDGTQFGSSSLVNDDIFALLVLQKSGYTYADEVILKTISFILSNQRSNGSWENSPDLTSAAVQSLYDFKNKNNIKNALDSAEGYLQSAQQSDGGWGNVYATSWVLLAMNVLGENWENNEKSGMDYLAEKQQSDGGVLSSEDSLENRIWATSYAIVAAQDTSWIESMNAVEKETDEESDVLESSPSNQENIEVVSENIVEENTILVPTTIVSNAPNAPIATLQTVIEEDVTSDDADEENQDVQNENNLIESNPVEEKKKTPILSIIAIVSIVLGFGLLFGRKFF